MKKLNIRIIYLIRTFIYKCFLFCWASNWKRLVCCKKPAFKLKQAKEKAKNKAKETATGQGSAVCQKAPKKE